MQMNSRFVVLQLLCVHCEYSLYNIIRIYSSDAIDLGSRKRTHSQNDPQTIVTWPCVHSFVWAMTG